MRKISSYYYLNIYLSNLYAQNEQISLKDDFVKNEPKYFKSYDKNGKKERKYDNNVGLFINIIV